MRKFNAGLGTGLVIGLLLAIILGLFNLFPPKRPSLISTLGHVPREEGKTAIEKYQGIANWRKAFSKETESLFIDSAGFKELMNTDHFVGFSIDIGLEKTSNRKSLQLLFSAVRCDTINGMRVCKRVFATKPENIGGEYYLDKISACPGSKNCPTD